MTEHATSEEIESEIERTRSGIGRTIDGLQRKLSPDTLIDETLRSARVSDALRSLGEDGVHLARRIGRAAGEHPLPLILTGAGLTWLAIANMRGRQAGDGEGYREDVASSGVGESWYRPGRAESTAAGRAASGFGESERMDMSSASNWVDAGDADDYPVAESGSSDSMSDRVKSTMEDARSRASDLGEQVKGSAKAASEAVGERVKHAAEAVKHSGSVAYDRTRGAAQHVTHVVREAPQRLGSAADQASGMIRENPILVGALAVAAGAALALMLPSSRREREIMGDASDQVKTQVREAVEEKLDRAKEVARSAAAAAAETARREVSSHPDEATDAGPDNPEVRSDLPSS